MATIYKVINYCLQTQTVYDYLRNCRQPVNKSFYGLPDFLTGMEKYIVDYITVSGDIDHEFSIQAFRVFVECLFLLLSVWKSPF